MNNKNRLVRVNKVNHLHKSAADSSSNYDPLPVALFTGKRSASIPHDHLGLLLGTPCSAM